MNELKIGNVKDIRHRRVLKFTLEENPSNVLDIEYSTGEIFFISNDKEDKRGINIAFNKLIKAREKGRYQLNGLPRTRLARETLNVYK